MTDPRARAIVPLTEDLPSFLTRVSKNARSLGWHVPGLIPYEGVCLWHGQPRTFKSLCGNATALAIAQAGELFSNLRFLVERSVPVAYFSEEDPERLFADRVTRLTAKGKVPTMLYPFIRQRLTFDNREGRDGIIDRLRSCGAEVAFFDPLRNFTDQADRGPADIAPVTRFLRQIQDETEAKAIVIIHHDVKPLAFTNWNAARSRSQQASGGGIFSASDCPVSFQRLSWNRVGVFPQDFKLCGDPEPFEVLFETNKWTDENGAPQFGTWVHPVATTRDEEEINRKVSREKVLDFLTRTRDAVSDASATWVATKDVARGAKVKDADVGLLLAELTDEGQVELRTGDGAKALGRSPNARLWRLIPVRSQSLPNRLEVGVKSVPSPIGEQTNIDTPRGSSGGHRSRNRVVPEKRSSGVTTR